MCVYVCACMCVYVCLCIYICVYMYIIIILCNYTPLNLFKNLFKPNYVILTPIYVTFIIVNKNVLIFQLFQDFQEIIAFRKNLK